MWKTSRDQGEVLQMRQEMELCVPMVRAAGASRANRAIARPLFRRPKPRPHGPYCILRNFGDRRAARSKCTAKIALAHACLDAGAGAPPFLREMHDL